MQSSRSEENRNVAFFALVVVLFGGLDKSHRVAIHYNTVYAYTAHKKRVFARHLQMQLMRQNPIFYFIYFLIQEYVY